MIIFKINLKMMMMII